MSPTKAAIGNPTAVTSTAATRSLLILIDRDALAEVDVLCAAHVGSGLPACSATMYAAYQSGQLASRLPVRFSCSPCAPSARRSALARSTVDANAVSAVSIRPGNRVVTSCSSQRLPSGSLKVTKDR